MDCCLISQGREHNKEKKIFKKAKLKNQAKNLKIAKNPNVHCKTMLITMCLISLGINIEQNEDVKSFVKLASKSACLR